MTAKKKPAAKKTTPKPQSAAALRELLAAAEAREAIATTSASVDGPAASDGARAPSDVSPGTPSDAPPAAAAPLTNDERHMQRFVGHRQEARVKQAILTKRDRVWSVNPTREG